MSEIDSKQIKNWLRGSAMVDRRFDGEERALYFDAALKRIETLEAALEGHSGGMTSAGMMDWLADRIVHIFNEDENCDYIQAARRRAEELRRAL